MATVLVDITPWRIKAPIWLVSALVVVAVVVHGRLVTRQWALTGNSRRWLGLGIPMGLPWLPVVFYSPQSFFWQMLGTIAASYLALKMVEANLRYGYFSTKGQYVVKVTDKAAEVAVENVQSESNPLSGATTGEHGKTIVLQRQPLGMSEYLLQVLWTPGTTATLTTFPYLREPGSQLKPLTPMYRIDRGLVEKPKASSESHGDDVMYVWSRSYPVATLVSDPPAWITQQLGLKGYFYYVGQALVYSVACYVLLLLPGLPRLALDPQHYRQVFSVTAFPRWPTWSFLFDHYAGAYMFYWGMSSTHFLVFGASSLLLNHPVPVLFDHPFSARTFYEFWSRRWNILFKDRFHFVVFQPVRRWISRYTSCRPMVAQSGATLAAFLFSALLHEYILLCKAGYVTGEEFLFFTLHGAFSLGQIVAVPWIRQAWSKTWPGDTWLLRITMDSWWVSIVAAVFFQILTIWTAPLFLYPYLREGLQFSLLPYLM
ncbi:hypothetical protein IWQ62_002070 [Dispira parvispora]|uniref:Wax synthase domain-containing protein n=1 Tax=Dispira parvispora TaxID=1520584 RepID=A0A9W8E8D1_9FUNG|nr:hypothetical protein IWQ62_002070 [Dispira parvispora]